MEAAATRLLALGRRIQIALAALIGALGALGQAPLDLWPATILSLALLFGLVRAAPGWRAAGLLGWAAGTGYFMVALFWIVEPFFVDAARHGWMAPFALFFLALGLAIFWAASTAVARALGGGAGAFAGAFILAEMARTYILTGFPWAQLGHVLIDTPLLHWSSYAGSLGLTALTLALAAGLWHLATRSLAAGAALALPPLALLALAPALTPRAPAAPDAATVRLIQPNAPQHEKWDPDKIPVFFERQIGFTAAPPTGPAPDLIVWPETAVPVMLNRAQPTLQAISDAAGGTPFVVGIQRLVELRYYNSLVRVDENAQVAALYDKHHLVPFGEYMPFGNVLKNFGIRGLASNDGDGYSAGPGPVVIDMGALGRALPLICYEGVFPQDVGGYDDRPDFLLLITNDAWFGEYSGPYQHLEQARLRSAEQGLPMVRVANTGVSAMIDATGRVTHSLPLGEAGWIDAPLPPALPPTVYARTGDWPMAVLAVLLLIAARSARARTGGGRVAR